MPLFNSLDEYSKSGIYPMHMPGHKRNKDFFPDINPVSIDITEIDGFDNLHNPTGIIKDEENTISRIYGSDRSFISVNGSTCAVISAIYALTSDGDTIIMARNCHISVYHAVLLRKLNVIFVNPQTDETTGICKSLSCDMFKSVLSENTEIKLAVITSPTYEGVVSDVKSIAEVLHEKSIPLIVDEAHGSHFVFSDSFPDTALSCSADVVINSFHKTLPCFTSCAVIHIKSNLVRSDKIKKTIDIFETSSPSYILMASMSYCMNMLENSKTDLFAEYINKLKNFNDKCKSLEKLNVLCYGNDSVEKHEGCFAFDKSKIVITTQNCNINSQQLYNILLNKYKIQCEMYSAEYVICMTSVADTDEGFKRLISALLEIDSTLEKVTPDTLISQLPHCEQIYNISQAEKMKSDRKPMCSGLISADYIYAYPPGTPVIIPGEKFNKNIIDYINCMKDKNVSIYDSDGEITDKVSVLCIDNEK